MARKYKTWSFATRHRSCSPTRCVLLAKQILANRQLRHCSFFVVRQLHRQAAANTSDGASCGTPSQAMLICLPLALRATCSDMPFCLEPPAAAVEHAAAERCQQADANLPPSTIPKELCIFSGDQLACQPPALIFAGICDPGAVPRHCIARAKHRAASAICVSAFVDH